MLIITLPILLLIIGAVVYYAPYIYEQYIVNQTQQTLNILKDAYAKTIKTANYQWSYDKMNTEIFVKEFVKNLPVKEDCGFNNTKCFSPCVRPKNAKSFCDYANIIDDSLYRVTLKNNVGVAMKINFPDCQNGVGYCGEIIVDANGRKLGPNALSRDMFNIYILKDILILARMRSAMYPDCIFGPGSNCTEYFLKYKNRRYYEYLDYAEKHPNERINTTRYDLQNTIISADK